MRYLVYGLYYDEGGICNYHIESVMVDTLEEARAYVVAQRMIYAGLKLLMAIRERDGDGRLIEKFRDWEPGS